MGVDKTFEAALAKALIAADLMLPPEGAILLSIADNNKAEALSIVRMLGQAGYKLYATEGTAEMVRAQGLPVEEVYKIQSGKHPNLVDAVEAGLVDGVINTPEGYMVATMKDGFHIRRAATQARIPCFTSLDTARVAIETRLLGVDTYDVAPLPEYRGVTAGAAA
jgi:carbamoyl-phosphate synthase large subunit